MTVWNPWRGCHRCSAGCKYCYIHKGDAKRGLDTDHIVRTERFYAPIETFVHGKKSGQYKMKSGFFRIYVSHPISCWKMRMNGDKRAGR